MKAGKRDSADRLILHGIWPEEIEAAKEVVQVGEPLKVIDYSRVREGSVNSYGSPVIARVIKKYPNLVFLDNGGSVTYAQFAIYYRGGKRRCIR